MRYNRRSFSVPPPLLSTLRMSDLAPARPASPRRRGFLKLGKIGRRAPGVPRLGGDEGRFDSPDGLEQPLRRDLLSVDQLADLARKLAGQHAVDPAGGEDRLLDRLAENARVIDRAYAIVSDAAEHDRRIAPAAEWLIDNYYLIEEQVRSARTFLPQGYSRELPRLVTGGSAGFPRVYALALELISHIDGRVDLEALDRFVNAYQNAEGGRQTLAIGELWAVPIMLRLALLENLRRVAGRVAADQAARDDAAKWAERLGKRFEKDPGQVVLELAELVRSEPTLSGPFVSEFGRRMQASGPRLALAMNWLTERLAERGKSVEQLVAVESQQQAADQASMGNSIGSLRLLNAIDWKAFVEEHSAVHAALARDPAGLFESLDFGTRDRYRAAVEKTARRASRPEPQVADRAVAMALAAGDNPRQNHVGYWLATDRGRTILERDVGARLGLVGGVRRLAKLYAEPLFFGVIVGAAILVTLGALWWSGISGVAGWVLALLAVPLLVAASQLGVSLVHWLIGHVVPPRPLPRLDLEGGIPAEFRTAVAVPCLLTSAEGVRELVEALEVRYLANREANLSFVLLSDFADCAGEHDQLDDHLLRRAAEGVADLNRQHGTDGGDGEPRGPFLLLHRGRTWNPCEGRWMGQERKRGKLEDFNRLLKDPLGPDGEAKRAFSKIEGDLDRLDGVQYVITLDADTVLPRDAARELVGTMAHPLNKPVIDERRGIVAKGYGILQPRASVAMGGRPRTLFVELFAGEPGVDPYTRAVSDVYQDAFEEGSFIGKGIYDVDAFHAVLDGRFPDNAILSHDLLEGSHVRSGLASDIQVFEDYPTNYLVDAARRHRWTRGDWQIALWATGLVPQRDGWARNPISLLSRWKIFDNLRRSLLPAALVLILLVGWLFVGSAGSAAAWTLFVMGVVFLPPVLDTLVRLANRPEPQPWRLHAHSVLTGAARRLGQTAVGFVALPYEAWSNLDAVGRTLWRLLVSRQKLLEWQTAATVAAKSRQELGTFYKKMAAAPAAAGLGLALVLLVNAPAWWAAAPVLLAWALAPLIAWRISRPPASRAAALSAAETLMLRHLARRTWRFFTTFVAAEDHYLPPDNFQEYPPVGVAHRTSPTNIGLALLSNLAAHDFGYASTKAVIDRCRDTFDGVKDLEERFGHLLNWYDTRTGRPLPPAYVSTVDSGNFVGCLMVLRTGLHGLLDAPAVSPRRLEGMRDTLGLLIEAGRGEDGVAAPAKGQEDVPPTVKLPPGVVQKAEALRDAPAAGDLAALRARLRDVKSFAAEAMASVSARDAAGASETAHWAGALAGEAEEALAQLDLLCPWAKTPTVLEAGEGEARTALADLLKFPTLRHVADLPQTLLANAAGLPAKLVELLEDAADAAARQARELLALADRAEGHYADAQFRRLLYDPVRKLMLIGYNAQEGRPDASFYDLLASEARLASYLTIARGELPQDHWFALGRSLTEAGGEEVLLSWSGSMFEYLMPLLVMPTYPGTLLDETYRGMLKRQIEYGNQRGVPWGISESGYFATDAQLNYQYRPFGVPGLGFKRGLSRDLVIAPYATAMGVMVDAKASAANLRRLIDGGFMGRYGLFEAIDYTKPRLPRGEEHAAVRSYMAHHSGMSFLALAYHLLDRPMQRRFLADPQLRSVDPPAPGAGAHCRPGHAPRLRGRGDDPPRGPPGRHAAALPHAQHARARGPPAGQRPVQRGGDQRRGRLQPVERHALDPLARGRNAGLLRDVRLPARHRRRADLERGLPADAGPARQLQRHLQPGQGRVYPPRRRHGDAHDRERQPRRGRGDGPGPRHRAAAGEADQPRPPAADHRSHELRRGRAQPGRRRGGAPDVQQPVHPDRAPARAVGDPGQAAPAQARREAAGHAPPDEHPRGGGGRDGV